MQPDRPSRRGLLAMLAALLFGWLGAPRRAMAARRAQAARPRIRQAPRPAVVVYTYDGLGRLTASAERPAAPDPPGPDPSC